MPRSLSIAAWACSLCGSAHLTVGAADACCACESCGGKFGGASAFTTRCDGCIWGERVRAARAAVRRAKEAIKSSEQNLSFLLATKPMKASQRP